MYKFVPVMVGIGGPISAIITGLSGFNKNLPWWCVVPLWCVVGTPLVLICPIMLPLYVLHVLSLRYRKQYSKHNDFSSELKNLDLEDVAREAAKATADTKASSSTNDTMTSRDGKRVLSEDEKAEQERIAKRASDLEDEVAFEAKQNQYNHLLVAHGLAKFNVSASLSKHMGFYGITLLLYYVVVTVALVGAAYAINLAMLDYVEIARGSNRLQIATAEQVAYGQAVVNIISMAGLAILIAVIICFASVCITVLKDMASSVDLSKLGLSASSKDAASSSNGANESSVNPVQFIGLGSAWSLFFKNLPGFAVVLAFFYAVFTICERYYANLRMIALEAMVLGNEYFDPSVLFMLIRMYVVFALCVALLMVVLMSLHVIPLSHRDPKSKLGFKR